MIIRLSSVAKGFIGVALLVLLSACGGGGGASSGGNLTLYLTDSATDGYQAVYVTIAEVQVGLVEEPATEAEWQTIMTPNQTYDLLGLVNGVRAMLGMTTLAPGAYSQMRLVLSDTPAVGTNMLGEPHPHANYLIDATNAAISLRVPSGMQTGIKIVHPFSILPSQSTDLVLDFDVSRSVVRAGNSGQWLMKPTIKILTTVENSVAGTVDDGISGLAGAVVSAQQFYDDAAVEPEERVAVATATVTDAGGHYLLYLWPDIYTIVATMDGYQPACTEIAATGFIEYGADFSLVPATTTGQVTGTISGLNEVDASATLSFQQTMDCGNGPVPVEVLALPVGDGGTYSVLLPTGTYSLVVAAAGHAAQVFSIDPLDEAGAVIDLAFDAPAD